MWRSCWQRCSFVDKTSATQVYGRRRRRYGPLQEISLRAYFASGAFPFYFRYIAGRALRASPWNKFNLTKDLLWSIRGFICSFPVCAGYTIAWSPPRHWTGFVWYKYLIKTNIYAQIFSLDQRTLLLVIHVLPYSKNIQARIQVWKSTNYKFSCFFVLIKYTLQSNIDYMAFVKIKHFHSLNFKNYLLKTGLS